MAVAPVDAEGVIADEFRAGGRDRAVVGGPHDGQQGAAQEVAFALATGAGAIFSQHLQRQFRLVAIRPGNEKGFGFLEVEIDGGGGVGHAGIIAEAAQAGTLRDYSGEADESGEFPKPNHPIISFPPPFPYNTALASGIFRVTGVYMRRVVITGLGAISPHGIGAPAFWNALLEAKSSISPLTRFDPSAFTSHVAAVIPPFKTTDYVPKNYRKSVKIMARDIELAVAAADLAVRDAKLITRGIAEGTPEATLLAQGWFKPDPARMGCNIGAGLICADLNELTTAVAEVRNPDNSMNRTKRRAWKISRRCGC